MARELVEGELLEFGFREADVVEWSCEERDEGHKGELNGSVEGNWRWS